MSEILSDSLASETIAEASRGRYLKIWADFKAFSDLSDEFDNRILTESEFVEFFKHLRTNKKSSSSSLWTIYSMLNSVCKGKYSERLQKFPRITSLLKSYNGDVKKKAAVFEEGDLKTLICGSSGPLYSILAGEEGGLDPGIFLRAEEPLHSK